MYSRTCVRWVPVCFLLGVYGCLPACTSKLPVGMRYGTVDCVRLQTEATKNATAQYEVVAVDDYPNAAILLQKSLVQDELKEILQGCIASYKEAFGLPKAMKNGETAAVAIPHVDKLQADIGKGIEEFANLWRSDIERMTANLHSRVIIVRRLSVCKEEASLLSNALIGSGTRAVPVHRYPAYMVYTSCVNSQ